MAREYIVYLAGPMTGTSVEESMEWRNYVRKHLPNNIKTRSPVLSEVDLSTTSGKINAERPELPLGKGKSFTRKDLEDVRRADLIFVNLLGAKIVSIGSVSELAWAYLLRKPTVVVMEKSGNIHDHPFTQEESLVIVDNLDEAIKLTKMLLLDDDLLLRDVGGIR